MGQSFYHYDTANQLVREDNAWLGKTFVWTYDNAGNITSRKEYAYINPDSTVSGTPTATYNYTYGDDSWGDLLTAYNGVARTYDEIGNVLTDGTWTYTWQNGRELAAMTDGTTTWNYTYDANGMRTSRTNGTKTYNYVYNGSQLTQMTVGNDTLYFTYGLLGPTTVTWNGTTYYYALNIQGDVVGIYDEAGNPVVTYNWDNAWGYNPIPEGVMASTLGTLNPLRYRGYVYDQETEYYYLQSRYYDPKIGRFINADGLVATGQGLLGNNMFAYCNNNPVNLLDPAGTYCCAIFGDSQLLHLNMSVYFSGGGSSHASGGVSTRGHYITMKEFLDTSDPEDARENLERYGVSYYQGVLVVRVDSMGYGGLSFGIILMGGSNIGDPKFNDTLKHEYGHTVHFNQIGAIDYFVTTAIPSLIFAELTNRDAFPYQYYFDLPWERTADQLGGVQRDYLPTSDFWSSAFWRFTLLYSNETPW